MANQDNKNFVNTLMDNQKQLVDTMVENTKKFANGNPIVSETLQKGSEYYNNFLNNQKNMYNQATEKTTNMAGTAKENMANMNEFYQNWFNTQMGWAKQMWEMNMNQFQTLAANQNTANQNPMAAWNNMSQNWTNWMSNMNNANSWMNNMQQWNNMFNMDAMKNATQNWTNIYNQFNETLNNSFTKFQENIKNGTSQDAYRNMLNATEGFNQFFEMWAPMWKSIQEKTFNMEVYKEWMNPAKYQEMMDKYFGFIPEGSRQYMQNMGNMMQEQMKQMNANAMNGYQQFRGMMNNMMPTNATEMFAAMMNGYNTFNGNMTEAYAPFAKMMGTNQHTKNMAEWQDIANRMAVYNIKNAELQYMMYTQGAKVMDNLAQNTMDKIQKGEEINSIMALYQEWMNISDKTFVALFESDEYSELMAEVSSMQLKLKKDVEMQMEKMFVNIPVATRSEMDEMYKTIYDLKKQVRQMEKMMDLNTDEVEETTAKATAAKTTKTAAKK